MTTIDRRGEFVAKHHRSPTSEEEAEIAVQEREDRRAAEAAKHETDVRRAYLTGTPGATPELWEKEKASILAKDREERALAQRGAAERSQAGIYGGY